MKTKLLHLEIKTCSKCPYNFYHEFNDVGTSFGMDYYCRLLLQGDMTNEEFYAGAKTKEQTRQGVRKNCPLPDWKG